jgi:hypothetical protein
VVTLSSTSANLSHNYTQPGTYQVRVINPESITDLSIQNTTLSALVGGRAKNLQNIELYGGVKISDDIALDTFPQLRSLYL